MLTYGHANTEIEFNTIKTSHLLTCTRYLGSKFKYGDKGLIPVTERKKTQNALTPTSVATIPIPSGETRQISCVAAKGKPCPEVAEPPKRSGQGAEREPWGRGEGGVPGSRCPAPRPGRSARPGPGPWGRVIPDTGTAPRPGPAGHRRPPGPAPPYSHGTPARSACE